MSMYRRHFRYGIAKVGILFHSAKLRTTKPRNRNSNGK